MWEQRKGGREDEVGEEGVVVNDDSGCFFAVHKYGRTVSSW